ncbi:hypothetical protein [Steroidobacter cummioxidans]|uniref:hypothetical protein n=1 Tax=Steroidobacter cummioxidans TaxID=1803913 RepID=UPI0019D42729|nr:hypothetical protein [Steroidobacter cummioxidans]
MNNSVRRFFLSVLLALASFPALCADISTMAAAIDRAAQAAIDAGESPGLQIAVFKEGASPHLRAA